MSLLSSLYIISFWWVLFFQKFKRYNITYNLIMYTWSTFLNFLLCNKYIVIGKENIDKKRTTLYICNHQSYLDIPTFVTNSHCTAISKKEVLKIPFVGILTTYTGTIFFDRNNNASRLSIIKEVSNLLNEGYSLCLFPEGTRSLNGALNEPNLALIRLCYKKNIPVVSSAIHGTIYSLKKGNYHINFFQKVVLKYTHPIYPKDFQDDEDFSNACWERVKKTHSEIKNEFFLKELNVDKDIINNV